MNQQNGNALLVLGYLKEAIQDCPLYCRSCFSSSVSCFSLWFCASCARWLCGLHLLFSDFGRRPPTLYYHSRGNPKHREEHGRYPKVCFVASAMGSSYLYKDMSEHIHSITNLYRQRFQVT